MSEPHDFSLWKSQKGESFAVHVNVTERTALPLIDTRLSELGSFLTQE